MSDDDHLEPMSPTQLGSIEAAVATYESERTPELEKYLEDRGIDPITMDEFRLGLCISPIAPHRWQRGRLAIPYLGPDGKAWQVRFRCLEKHDHEEHHHGKYNTVKGDPSRIFNVGAIHRAGNELHIAEGELDAIVLNQLGYHAIGIPGVNNWKPHFATAVRGFSRIYVWGDDDDAGSEWASFMTQKLRRAVAVPIKGGDVTDVYLRDGEEGIRSLVERSV